MYLSVFVGRRNLSNTRLMPLLISRGTETHSINDIIRNICAHRVDKFDTLAVDATNITRERWIQRITFAAETNAAYSQQTQTRVTAWRRATQYLLRLLSGGERNNAVGWRRMRSTAANGSPFIRGSDKRKLICSRFRPCQNRERDKNH